MKIKNIILSIIGVLFIINFVACSDSEDNDNGLIIPTQIELDKELVIITVDEDNKAEVNITKGGGEYSILAVNPNIATAKINGNVVEIEGLKNGETDIIIMDNNGSVKNISVHNEYSKITIEGGIINFEHFMGRSSSIEITPLTGNGNYEVILDEESQELLEAKGGKDSFILKNLVNTGTVKIKIKDSKGLETEFTVEITTSVKPYTDIEIEEIKNSKEIIFEWNYNPFSYFSETINTQEGDFNVIGADYYGMTTLKVFFPGDKSVGERNNCRLMYNTWGSQENLDLTYFEIIKNDGNLIWIVFSYIDQEKEIAKMGKIIAPL